MFLLDTNIVSELNKPYPDREVTRWIRSVPQSDLFMSVVTIAEIVNGITRHPDPARRQVLQRWLDDVVRPWLRERIIPVSEPVAELTGQITGEHEVAGKAITFADAAIAATAMHQDFTLVTRNTKDFNRISVPLYNPWQPDRPTL